MKKPSKALSVELQTVTFVDAARKLEHSSMAHLHAKGFKVTLEFEREITVRGVGTLKEALAIVDVYVPLHFRRQGWFSTYVRLCQMVADEALLVLYVYGPVRESLLRKGFKVVAPDALMFTK